MLRGSLVQKLAALFMCLSVLITGPICLFNRGNIIASLSVCVCVCFLRLEDAYGTVAVQRGWRDATELHGIRVVLQLSVYLLIRST